MVEEHQQQNKEKASKQQQDNNSRKQQKQERKKREIRKTRTSRGEQTQHSAEKYQGPPTSSITHSSLLLPPSLTLFVSQLIEVRRGATTTRSSVPAAAAAAWMPLSFPGAHMDHACLAPGVNNETLALNPRTQPPDMFAEFVPDTKTRGLLKLRVVKLLSFTLWCVGVARGSGFYSKETPR